MGFTLLNQQPLQEACSTGLYYEHDSGAKLIRMQNDDQNRVFSIAFKTPPKDDSGVAHIVEHCVLCGSHKYPLKDPFNELSKGVMHTYLNAMTFQDKTLYPIAGVRYPDFLTMVDVYLDSVFHPLLEHAAFLQEGRHTKEDGSVAGIVLSEMTGVHDDPIYLLKRKGYQALFPHSDYRFDATGSPDGIIQLSFDTFQRFYQAHYTPANSYIYLYGDMDAKDVMSRIDRCLSNARPPAHPLPFIHCNESFEHAIVKDETYFTSQKIDTRYLAAFYNIGTASDVQLNVAMEILSAYLFQSPASPFKHVLYKKLSTDEISGFFDDEILHPVIGVLCKNTMQTAAFMQKTMADAITDVITHIDPIAIRSCISRKIFELREGYYGYKPKGLAFNIRMLHGWTHGYDPFERMKRLQYLEALQQKSLSYFQELLSAHLLNNNHAAYISLSAISEPHRQTAVKLSDSLLHKRILDAFHAHEDEPEALATIPILPVAPQKPAHPPIQVETKNDVRVLFQSAPTDGVVYIDFIFHADKLLASLDVEESFPLPYVKILSWLLGKVSTAHRGLLTLQGDVDTYLGGLDFTFHSISSAHSDTLRLLFVAGFKSLEEHMPKLFDLAADILCYSDFHDKEKIKELLQTLLSNMEAEYITQGHHLAISQAAALASTSCRYVENAVGLEAYFFIKNVLHTFDASFETLADDLDNLACSLFAAGNFDVAVTGSAANWDHGLSLFTETLRAARHDADATIPSAIRLQPSVPTHSPIIKRIGLIRPGAVCSHAMAISLRQSGIPYSGVMALAAEILTSDYLLKEIRLKGGAYDLGCQFDRNGIAYFYSDHDPQSAQTIEAFQNAWLFLKNFNSSDREFQKYKVAAMNKLQKPIHPSVLRKKNVEQFYSGIHEDDLWKEQEEIARCSAGDIKNLHVLLMETAEKGCFCTIGPEALLAPPPKAYLSSVFDILLRLW